LVMRRMLAGVKAWWVACGRGGVGRPVGAGWQVYETACRPPVLVERIVGRVEPQEVARYRGRPHEPAQVATARDSERIRRAPPARIRIEVPEAHPAQPGLIVGVLTEEAKRRADC